MASLLSDPLFEISGRGPVLDTNIYCFTVTKSELCGSEEFWEQAVRRCCTTVSAEVASLALEVGWRSVFFTNKLQLQKLISRRRLKTEEQQASDPDTKTEESPDVSSETNQTSGFDEDSHPGIIPSLCTNAGADLKTSFCCDVDPEPNSEPEDGSLF